MITIILRKGNCNINNMETYVKTVLFPKNDRNKSKFIKMTVEEANYGKYFIQVSDKYYSNKTIKLLLEILNKFNTNIRDIFNISDKDYAIFKVLFP